MTIIDKTGAFLSPASTGNSAYAFKRLDPRYLDSDVLGGVSFMTEFASPVAYAGATSPIVNGQVVKNLARLGANGAIIPSLANAAIGDAMAIVPGGQTIGFLGGGADFSLITSIAGAGFNLPAAVSADIFGSAQQYPLIGMGMKLPPEASWQATNTVCPYYTHAPSTAGDTTAPDLVSWGGRTVTGSKKLTLLRQITFSGGVGTYEPAMDITLPGGCPAFGSPVLPIYWRNASGQSWMVYFLAPSTFTGSIAGNVLSVTSPPGAGSLLVGTPISGTGVAAGQTIAAFLGSTGGAGNYALSASQATVASSTLTASLLTSLAAPPVAVGANNAGDFSATQPFLGIDGNRWTTAILTAGAGNFRLYKPFVENLYRTGRDPNALGLALAQRFFARNRFS